ncbi:cell wall protein DAN4-like [Haliotis rufescens]|uniref:cell wall protein DAN4-like n=1 Tax=Haliotis rufescens TaxID=6454 RepID=UPI00201F339B|nr:cell wall protein DAN4-like [Haliotis rufescens]
MLCIEGLMYWIALICGGCMSLISVNGTPVFNTFYGPSRAPPSQTLSSTATTSTPTASSTLQYTSPAFGTQISIDDPVVSTLSVTTTNPTTTTTNKTAATTLLTYTNTSSSTSTLTSTAISTPSSHSTDFDQQRNTSLEHEGNSSSTDSTSVWSTTSSPGSTVQNASPDNQQNDKVDNLNTLGGVISGSVVGAFILLLAFVAVFIFVGHRRNPIHEVRPEDEYSSMYLYHCVMALPFAYKP